MKTHIVIGAGWDVDKMLLILMFCGKWWLWQNSDVDVLFGSIACENKKGEKCIKYMYLYYININLCVFIISNMIL